MSSAAKRLAGKVAVITGAGSGVGAATCKLLAQEKATIALIGRNADKLKKVQETLDCETLLFAGDVCDSDFCQRSVSQTVAQCGRLDLLINSAALMRRGNVAEFSDSDWAAVMHTNVDGVFYMSRAAVQAMEGSGGAIVNVASTCAIVGVAGLAAYCASKGAVVQLTRAMALECAEQKITVNAVCPGAIEAPMLFSAQPDGTQDKDVRQRNIAAIPLRQIATAEEVARAILYLACEPHITGSLLSIDGGYTAG